MRIIRYNQLHTKGITYSRQQLRRKIAAGEFPAPIPLDNRECAAEAHGKEFSDELMDRVDKLRRRWG